MPYTLDNYLEDNEDEYPSTEEDPDHGFGPDEHHCCCCCGECGPC